MSEERNESRADRKSRTIRPVLKTFTVFCQFGEDRLSELTFEAPEGFTARDVDRFQQRLEERDGVIIYRKPKYQPKRRDDDNRGGYRNRRNDIRGGRNYED